MLIHSKTDQTGSGQTKNYFYDKSTLTGNGSRSFVDNIDNAIIIFLIPRFQSCTFDGYRNADVRHFISNLCFV